MKKIALIEDDPVLHQNIMEVLISENYEITSFFNGELADRALTKDEFDVILLDINLPGKSGYEICKNLRDRNNETPILMLTAFSELDDKVKGFESGADDYLTKPFFMRELILRIDALLKRSKKNKQDEGQPIIQRGHITLNKKTKTVEANSVTIELTPREYQILLRLLEADGEFVSKKELIQEIWGTSVDMNTNTVEVYINFLRNKIDKPFNLSSIKTKVGYGYYVETT